MANIWDINPSATGGTTSSGGAYQPPQPAYQAPTNNNSWYQPGNGYGATQDWYSTEVGQQIREQNLPLAFSAWGSRMGVPDDNSAFSRWFQQQQPRFQRAYGQATMDNPMLNIDQFMATLPGMDALRREFEMQSPATRGAQFSMYAPNVRWIPR